jgi:hypothetical protein
MIRYTTDALHQILQIGLHAFRRFRIEILRETGVPENLLRYWIGHSRRDVTSLYAEGLLLKREAQPSSGLVE